MTPIDRLCYWITERESIRKKKDAGEPRPWTDDPILGQYRFCNVRRMDDKVSKWLWKNWYAPNIGHRLMIPNIVLARFLNLPSTMAHIGYQTEWRPIALKKKLREWRDAGNTVFNSAYMVAGVPGIDKIESVVSRYVAPLVEFRLPIDCTSMERTWANLCDYVGMGSFMAGQVIADARHCLADTTYWADKMTWAPPGPGSMRGLNRLHKRHVDKKIAYNVFQRELVSLIKSVLERVDREITIRLEAHDYQNCLCEFDKYERARNAEGRPKQNYRPATADQDS